MAQARARASRSPDGSTSCRAAALAPQAHTNGDVRPPCRRPPSSPLSFGHRRRLIEVPITTSTATCLAPHRAARPIPSPPRRRLRRNRGAISARFRCADGAAAYRRQARPSRHDLSGARASDAPSPPACTRPCTCRLHTYPLRSTSAARRKQRQSAGRPSRPARPQHSGSDSFIFFQSCICFVFWGGEILKIWG